MNPTEQTTPPSLKRRLLQPTFLIVAGILLVCAVGLNGAIQSMQLSFQKKPVPLAEWGKELTTIPADLGPWKMVGQDGRLNEDVEHALGTKQYVFRDYVDERIVGADRIAQMRQMDEAQRFRAMAELQQQHNNAVVNLAVTYYTGLVDTVPHIPDRCYIADGYQPSVYVNQTWQTQPNPTTVRFITFEDQTGYGKLSRNVAYFFFVNGKQTEDPLGVRVALQNLLEKYGFFSKVELMVARADPETASKTMEEFFIHAKPEIVKCLPDWSKVIAQDSGQSAAGSGQ